MNIKKWVVAARLRTLPLSSSAVLMGVTLGLDDNRLTDLSWRTIVLITLILITAVVLQVISNFANDYGDAVSGVDNDKRVGPKRSLFLGEMTMKEMKYGIISTIGMAVIFGCGAIGLALYDDLGALAVFMGLGLLSIIAAITYTIGIVYGYKGLGDISVFTFFGLVAVLGAEYMLAKEISFIGILLACAAGFMATLVLNVNNLRDFESDRLSGKNSLVVKFGLKGGKFYHAVLLLGTVACLLLAIASLQKYLGVLPLVAFIPLLIFTCYCIHPAHVNSCLDPMLKKTSIGASVINLSWCLIFLLDYNNICY